MSKKVIFTAIGLGVFVGGVVALSALFPEIVGGAVDADFVAGDADGDGFFEQCEKGFAALGGEFGFVGYPAGLRFSFMVLM